jgi:hypothetical protein
MCWWAWLPLFITVIGLNGCVDLPRRTPMAGDHALTSHTIAGISGDYRAFIGPHINGDIDRFELLAQLTLHRNETQSEERTPVRLSVAAGEHEIRLTVRWQDQVVTHSYAYELVDGEIQLERITRFGWRWVVLWSVGFLKAGIVSGGDGSLLVRRVSNGIGVIVILPLFAGAGPPDGFHARLTPWVDDG